MKGDVVVIVLGAQTPVVMRSGSETTAEGQYVLVGDCYIHGIMDDEAIVKELELDVMDVI
jgi:hypothetical protein